MTETDPVGFLCQRDLRQRIEAQLGEEEWLTVYSREDSETASELHYCALIPTARVPAVLDDVSWDLHIGGGMPGYIESFDPPLIEYHRINERGVEPLVICRSFAGMRPGYEEILEEFRFFHDLCWEPSRQRFVRFSPAGDEIVVIEMLPNRIRIRRRELRQFLAVKGMHLALLFTSDRHSMLPLEQVPAVEHNLRSRTEQYCYRFTVGNDQIVRGKFASYSHLLGKKLVPPLPIAQSGMGPYAEVSAEPFETFIIGVDADGQALEHSCDAGTLSNYFGANPGAPNYLTPVCFRRDVLGKYYQDHEKYRVHDGHVDCGGLWSLRIDNDAADGVYAFLGDLGRDLPASERKYWRSFNIPPQGGMSDTAMRRSFFAEFAAPTQPDLRFKQQYLAVRDAWRTRFGWDLFLALDPADAYRFETLHGLLGERQAEFDDQVLSLTKLVVDSLNEAQLVVGDAEVPNGAKGITKLERFLSRARFPEMESVIPFLRRLQAVRSTGVAHRKGTEYARLAAELGLESRSFSEVFADLLIQASLMLEALRAYFLAAPPSASS